MSIIMFSKGTRFRNTALVTMGMVLLTVIYLGGITHLLNPYQDKKVSLDPYLEFFTMTQEDEDSISFDEWLAKKDFEPLSEWDSMASREHKVYWFRFNSDDVGLPSHVPDGLIELNEGRRYWTVKSLSLYLMRGSDFQLLSRSGLTEDEEGDPLSGGFALPFSIEGESDAPSTIYIRAVVRENFQPTFRLWKHAAWQQQFQYKQDIIFSLNLGILFCLMVFSGLSALSQRSRMLGAYFGYLLVSTVSLVNVWQSQTGNWLFWPEPSYVFFGGISVFVMACGIWFLTVFTRDFLNVGKEDKGHLTLKAINWLNILSIVAILISFFLFNFHVTLNSVALKDLIISCLFLYVGYCSLCRYRRHAILYILAFSIMFLLTASFHLIRLCYLPEWPYPLSQLPLQDMGLAGGSFILALAMVDRLKSLQLERDKAQREALLNLERLHNQEETARRDLSQKVEERTQALGVALKESKQANEAKNVFLANMSHELRTPLNAIIGYAQLMQSPSFDLNKLGSSVNTIEQSGAHLLELINDILNLSKIEAGQIRTENTVFNLKELLAELVVMFRISTEKKGLKLKYDDSKTPEMVKGDLRLLRQILINVLGNAVKFTEKGFVSLTVNTAYSGHLSFCISDSGVGILPEDLERIFDPFTQSGGDDAKHKGTGLGLSISRKMAQIMGGDICVESELGEGSVFTVDLPLNIEAGDIPKTASVNHSIHFVGEPKCVLVIDDEASNRALIRDLLEDVGLKVLEAESGSMGLSVLGFNKVDLVLLDLRMPEMDGFSVASEISSQEKWEKLPIIAFSAGVETSMKEKALESGCSAFLPKPVNRYKLLDLLQKYLNLQKKIDSRDLESTIADKSIPEELLIPVIKHANAGYVDGLRNALKDIETKVPEATFFNRKTREMLHNFDLEGIVALASKIKNS